MGTIGVSFKESLFPSDTGVVRDWNHYENINGASYLYLINHFLTRDYDKAVFLSWAYNYHEMQTRHPGLFETGAYLDDARYLLLPLRYPPNESVTFSMRSDLSLFDKALISQIIYPNRELLFNGYFGGDTGPVFGTIDNGLEEDTIGPELEKPALHATAPMDNKYVYFFVRDSRRNIQHVRTYSSDQLTDGPSGRKTDEVIYLPADHSGTYYLYGSDYELSDDRLAGICQCITQYNLCAFTYSRKSPFPMFLTPRSSRYSQYRDRRTEIVPRSEDSHYRTFLEIPLTHAVSILQEAEETEEKIKQLDSSNGVQQCVEKALLGHIDNLERYISHITEDKQDMFRQKLHCFQAYNAKLRMLSLQAAHLLADHGFNETLIDMDSKDDTEDRLKLIAALQVLALSSREGLDVNIREYNAAKDAAEILAGFTTSMSLEELRKSYVNPNDDPDYWLRSPASFNWYTQFLLPLRGDLNNVAVEVITSLSTVVQKAEGENFREKITDILGKWKIRVRDGNAPLGEPGDLSSNDLKTVELSAGSQIAVNTLNGLMQVVNLALALKEYNENKDLASSLKLLATAARNANYLRDLGSEIGNAGSLIVGNTNISWKVLSAGDFLLKNLGDIISAITDLYEAHERGRVNDSDAAMAHAASAIFTIMSIFSSGPFAIAWGFAATFCGIASALFKDTPLEIWLKSCSFGNTDVVNNPGSREDNTAAPWANGFEPWTEREQVSAFQLIPYTPSQLELHLLYSNDTNKLGCIAFSFTLKSVTPNVRYRLRLSLDGGRTVGDLDLERGKNLLMGYHTKGHHYRCYAFFHTDEWDDYYQNLPFQRDNAELLQKIAQVKQSFSIDPPQSTTVNYSEVAVLGSIESNLFFYPVDNETYTPKLEQSKSNVRVLTVDTPNKVADDQYNFYSIFAHYDLNMDGAGVSGGAIRQFFQNIFS